MTKSSSQKKKKLKTTPSDPLQETHFEPVKIEIENSHNLLILLKCEDYKVQVQALYHLRKYLSKANSVTVELMIKKDILASLLPLLKNKDLCIRKLSYAILSNLIDHSSVRFTLQDASWTETFLEAFFNTILNYLEDETIKCEGIKLETLVKLIDSEYPVIQQLTLDVLTSMMKRHDGIETQLKFKHLGGFNKLMNYLEKPEYEDIHPRIMEIFGSVTDNEKIEIMEANTLRKLLLLSRKILNVDKLEKLWNTIIRLAHSKRNNQILMDYNLMETIKSFLHSSNERLIIVACKAISQLLKDLDQIENVFEHISIDSLTGLMEQNIAGRTKEAVMSALLSFLKFHTIDEKDTVEMDKFRFILNILASSGTNMEVSVELMREIITCLTILVQNSFYRDRLDPKEYIDHLTRHLLESEDDQLSITILACLSQLVYDDRMCQVLCDGYIQKLWEQLEKNLDKNKVSLAVGQFILIASSAHQSAANAFIRVGLLEWLIGKKKCELIPVWQSVMHRLFENHLSAKFTLYDRLEFTDVIKDRFYAWRLNESKDNMSFNDVFPFYENLHQLSSSTELVTDTNVIYVVNLNPKEGYTSSPKNSVQSRSSNQSFGSGAIGSFSSKRSSSKRVSEEEKISRRKNSSNETSKFALCGDPFMREYVNELNEILKEEEKTANIEEPTTGIGRNVFDIQNQLKILAHFVCNQLSGADNNVPCTKHYFDLHISDLKTEVKSRMLPLGVLRLGLSFERALLFKTLADQMGFPCALQRGNHGHGWVEVALTSFDKAPTHVVDLMHSPGELMRLNTPHAHEYMACPKLITAHPP
ncbi:armadillo repeat-containing protein 3 isoform X2 [Nilaparvata lugens]|uniref:armadillo repeat-containing protein 3 isoform X2 n=1 Tax=Nilaparvata lugens TaxID=108931 RepID=UPI00193DEB9E|nr:armadillo repeat-containing protein 3 isoform X2 [Nilaparvata lugens]